MKDGGNIRSFLKHSIDIGHSKMLLQTDIFCLMTQHLWNQEITDTISENLDQFYFINNRRNDQFKLGCIGILKNHTVVGRSVLTFTRCGFSPDPNNIDIV